MIGSPPVGRACGRTTGVSFSDARHWHGGVELDGPSGWQPQAGTAKLASGSSVWHGPAPLVAAEQQAPVPAASVAIDLCGNRHPHAAPQPHELPQPAADSA